MSDRATPPRSQIVEAARTALAADPGATMATIARGAGVSRATVHRYFAARADLLVAVGQEPDPGTRDRILAAAAELIGREGFAAMSMDDLAAKAGVSRASVYRLFPGKGAVLEAIFVAYSPFSPMIDFVDRSAGLPPDRLVPELYRLMAREVEPNIGILRSILMEVTSGSAEGVEAAQGPVKAMVRSLGGYLERQMDAGLIARANPVLAVQFLLGPLVFHLLTRPTATRIGALDVAFESGIDQLAVMALRSLTPPHGGKEHSRE